MPDLHISLTKTMTSSVTSNKFSPAKVTFPAYKLIETYKVDRFIIEFLDHNCEGVRNCDVGRAIGYNDSRQWFSYGILERLIKEGKVEKRSIKGTTLYFSLG